MDELPDMPARRGRGSRVNPANQYERLHVELDPDTLNEDELRQVETKYFADPTQSILSTNDSPDVPFTYSINPYRGCEHGCVYCLSGDTRILMGDGGAKPLEKVQTGDVIYGTEREGFSRQLTQTRVLDRWTTTKTPYRITFATGKQILASGDHRFLAANGWSFVTGSGQGFFQRQHLTPHSTLIGLKGQSGVPRLNDPGQRITDQEISHSSCSITTYPLQDSRSTTRNDEQGRQGLLERNDSPPHWTPSVDSRPDHAGQVLGPSIDYQIIDIERLTTPMVMHDLTTGTGDFIANGIVSHNCYARPTHEYLGFSAGLDFETRILVKKNAPQLLSQSLQKKTWTPEPICLSGNTDPYQPGERALEVTRDVLRVLAQHRNPVQIITKSGLITRDLDILQEMAAWNGVSVTISITTLDDELAGAMEPRAARPPLRLRAIEECAEAGIPVGVNAAPIIPGLTDEEVPRILEAAAERGATSAGYTVLRLPGAVRNVFVDWLERHAPDRKERVLNRLRSLRDGDLNDSEFGRRMRGQGLWADTIGDLFRLARKKHGFDENTPPLNTEAFRRRPGGQIGLFESAA